MLACFQGLQRASRLWKAALPLSLTAAAVTIIDSGKLNSLSLAQEFYAVCSVEFAEAQWQHVEDRIPN